MKDLNIRQEAIKILEEKTGNNLFDLGCSNFLLDTSPEAKETKQTISKAKRQPMEWEKIFANDISDKGSVSNTHEELIKLNTNPVKQTINETKTNNPEKKWAKDMNRHFSKEDIQTTNRHMKKMLNITHHQGNTNQNHN